MSNARRNAVRRERNSTLARRRMTGSWRWNELKRKKTIHLNAVRHCARTVPFKKQKWIGNGCGERRRTRRKTGLKTALSAGTWMLIEMLLM
jgi:hypothetical protein